MCILVVIYYVLIAGTGLSHVSGMLPNGTVTVKTCLTLPDVVLLPIGNRLDPRVLVLTI